MSEFLKDPRMYDHEWPWHRLLNDLDKAGFNNVNVAKQLQLSPQRVHYWKMGGEPPYSQGRALVSLYQKIFSCTLESV